ncbi:argininosuccinate lyase, partial [Streptomyces sp. SID2955]|nr:argininosuccinate lyase [Streptomyces sp. SID2955]
MSRLTATVGRQIQRLVYGTLTPADIADELSLTTEIDLAHLVMLVECRLIPPADAAALIRRIGQLRAEDFRSLYGVPVPR